MRDLALVLAVRIHHPDFFVAGPVGNEVNMRAGQGLAAEESQDIGGKFVRDFARAGLVDRAQVVLPIT